ncbi:MAG: hypothetical protein KC729_15460, partial [Candidatus Eisenbacteria bacterium]|nr:hypothetical protein [Candidatus Eisenbacteria bacterium]
MEALRSLDERADVSSLGEVVYVHHATSIPDRDAHGDLQNWILEPETGNRRYLGAAGDPAWDSSGRKLCLVS